ncbi:MAG: acetate--CoA ligase, partial [Erythrobacter sp.]|nr:acetate--CoA ligase [Erythrobacter sp.]
MLDVVRRLGNAEASRCTLEQFDSLYERSIEDSDGFWLEQAKRLDWFQEPSRAGEWSYDPVEIAWFADGKLNLCHNAVDRHLDRRGDDTAIIFEPDDPQGDSRTLTYRQLHAEVVGMANALKAIGVTRGDRVTIYMPMIVEGVLALLACARIGAVHSVVFGGFSPEALAGRIEGCGSRFVVTADEGLRGGKRVPLKANVDAAIAEPDHDAPIDGMLVVRHTGADIPMTAGRDHWYHEVANGTDCPCEPMDAEDPLFILYTSGSTGKPKGVVHTTGGYGVWTATTFAYVFDYQPGEVFWCTADIGWITGHSYIAYGPLLNGATQVVFEGVPSYPDHGRFWEVVDRHKVNILYTAPTAIRALMREGDGFVTSHNRSSLRLLGTVGEPINPEAWRWYFDVVGEKRCPIVDTWWQTETGGIMITPLPGAVATKPGSATLPFPGIHAEVLDQEGRPAKAPNGGFLVLQHPWPGMLRGIWGDPKRYREQYWSQYPDTYFAGDGAHRDRRGYFWVMGRIDDEMNISGHRIGTMEVESALVSHR